MDVDYAKQEGFEIIATLGEHAEIGCDPAYMGYAPYHAVTELLAKAKKDINDIEVVEMTEAFAAQSIPVKIIWGYILISLTYTVVLLL